MNIVVYTLPYAVSNEAEKINNLFEEGLDELHLRKCRFSIKDTEAFLKQINPAYLNKVVLHMHYSLASKYKVKGIHVSSSFFDGFFGLFRKNAINPALKIYTTVSKSKEIDKLTFPFHHVLLGPLFKRFSSDHYTKNFNSFELNKILLKTKQSVFALGGIELDNVSNIENFKFDALVLQSSIWKSDDYLNAFNAFAYKKTADIEQADNQSLGLRVS